MLLSNLNLLATAPDGVAKLRELILTLAVQGKLVPQDPKDEPASVLLKKIRAEKDRLIAEGKIKRDKPLAEIAEEEKPFELPQGWEWVRLGNLLPFRIGKTPPSKDPQYWAEEGYAWVSISDMTHFGEVFDTNRRITAKGASVFGYEPLPVGTLIMSFKLTIGKIAVLRVPAYHNEAIISLMPLGGLHTEFLKFMLPTVSKTGASKDALMGATLNTESLSNLLIALPPLAEQSRIVTRVEELMRLCDALQAKTRLEATQHAQLFATLLATLTASTTPEALTENWHRVATHFDLLLDRPEAVDALEQTILQLAVRGLLVPQDPQDEPASALLKKIRAEKDKLIAEGKIKRDKPLPPIAEDEKPFDLPQGWEWVRLGEVADTRLGKMLDKAKNTGKRYPYLRNTNVQWRHIDLDDIKEIRLEAHELDEFRLVPGDLLICEGGYPGRCAIWNEPVLEMYFQKALHRVRPRVGIATELVAISLEADSKAGNLDQHFTGATIKHFVGQALDRYVMPLPPLAEQSRIVARVASLRALCADLRQRLTTARTQQALLAQALVQEVA